jgi:hypothetical protein
MIIQLDTKAPLPKTALNFLIKNLAGGFLYFFQQQVQKICNDPDSTHAQRIRSNTAFYRDWVLPKLRYAKRDNIKLQSTIIAICSSIFIGIFVYPKVGLNQFQLVNSV